MPPVAIEQYCHERRLWDELLTTSSLLDEVFMLLPAGTVRGPLGIYLTIPAAGGQNKSYLVRWDEGNHAVHICSRIDEFNQQIEILPYHKRIMVLELGIRHLNGYIGRMLRIGVQQSAKRRLRASQRRRTTSDTDPG